MTKSLIVLKKHFGGNDTLVVQIEGQKYVSNGCQTFHSDKLDYVCTRFNVNDTAKQLVVNALNELDTDCLDLLEAIKVNVLFLQFIENKTDELCLGAVKISGAALCLVKNKTPEICLAAVKQNGYALCLIDNQTVELCFAAVKQDGLALQYVKNQTPEICLAAVKQNKGALEYVKNKTSEILLAAGY